MDHNNVSLMQQTPTYSIYVKCSLDVGKEIYQLVNMRRGVTIRMYDEGVQFCGENQHDLWDSAYQFFILYSAKVPGTDSLDMCFQHEPLCDAETPEPMNSREPVLKESNMNESATTTEECATHKGQPIYLERTPGAFVFCEIIYPEEIMEKIAPELHLLQNPKSRLLQFKDRLRIWTLCKENAQQVEHSARTLIENQLGASGSHPTITYNDQLLTQMSSTSLREMNEVKDALQSSTTTAVLDIRGLNQLDGAPPQQNTIPATKSSRSESMETDDSERCSSGGEAKKKEKEKRKQKKKRKEHTKKKASPAPTKATTPRRTAPNQNPSTVAQNVPSPSRTIPSTVIVQTPTRPLDYRNVQDEVPRVGERVTVMQRASDGKFHNVRHISDGIALTDSFSISEDSEKNGKKPSIGPVPQPRRSEVPKTPHRSPLPPVRTPKRVPPSTVTTPGQREPSVTKPSPSVPLSLANEVGKPRTPGNTNVGAPRTPPPSKSPKTPLPKSGRAKKRPKVADSLKVSLKRRKDEQPEELDVRSVILHRQQSARHSTVPSPTVSATVPEQQQKSQSVNPSDGVQVRGSTPTNGDAPPNNPDPNKSNAKGKHMKLARNPLFDDAPKR